MMDYDDDDRRGRRDSFGRDERRIRRRDEPDEFEPRKRGRRSPSPYGNGGYRGRHDEYAPRGRYGGGYDRRGGPGHSMIPDPYKLEYLAPFPLFAEFSRHQEMKRHGRSNLSNEELERRYENYKDVFVKKLQVKFFETHKDEEWFREKYHPEESIPLKQETKQRRQELLARFVTDFESGKFDEICFDGPPTTTTRNAPSTSATGKPEDAENENVGEIKEGEPEHKNEDEDADHEVEDAAEAPTVDSSKAILPPDAINSLFIRSVPFGTKRSDLLQAVQHIEGFKYLVITDPRPEKKNSRLGWYVFAPHVNIEEICIKLNETKVGELTLYLSLHTNAPSRIRAIPPDSSKPSRLLHDLNQIRRLANTLDKEAGFAEDNGVAFVERRLDTLFGPFDSHVDMPPQTEEETRDGETPDENNAINVSAVKKRLDAIIVYLRKVHNYDYYFGTESTSPEDFSRRSHIAVRKPFSEYRPRDPNSKKETFLERLDSRITLRIEKPTSGPLVLKRGGKDLEKALEDEMHDHIQREADTKYRCQFCSKLFKGEEYVFKHIRGKHSEFVDKVSFDIQYYNAYALDANKVDPLKTTSPPPPPMMMGPPMFFPPPLAFGMIPPGMYGGPMRPPPPMAGSFGQHDRGYPPRNGSGPTTGNAPRPPPANARRDPRQLKSYHDLDAPAGGEIELKYD